MQKAKTLSKLLLVILSIVVGINLSYAESRSYLSPIEQRKKREARLLLEKQKQAAGVREESLKLLLEAQSKRSLDLIKKQVSVQKAVAQRNQKVQNKQQNFCQSFLLIFSSYLLYFRMITAKTLNKIKA